MPHTHNKKNFQLLADLRIMLKLLPDVKNTQAELYAIDKCIEVCNQLYLDEVIIIFTDCQRAFINYKL